jgi:hypothetical protein
MSVINGIALTNLAVAADGSAVSIDVSDENSMAGSLVLSVDALQSLIMSLPRAMQQALQLRYCDPSLRLVYPLGNWRLETSTQSGKLLLTLATGDGFEVTFAVIASDLERLAGAATRAEVAGKLSPN